ncbi:MAG: FHA domain-containing protein [Planctomycetota bacterium]|nr:FHA domain-containing protein [Planctomycetota bacterium]
MKISLKVLSGNHEGKLIPIKEEKFFIGRGDDCQLRPKSESVSRRHCALVQKEGRLLLLDLKSRNGTFVNDKQLSHEKAKILKSGDQIRVGQLEFEVVIEIGIANTKKPEVHTTQEVVERIIEQAEAKLSDSRESVDISSWLLEADQVDRRVVEAEPDTRKFQVDETTHLDSEILHELTEAEAQKDASDDENQSGTDSGGTDSGGTASKSKRPEKKPPMKLPKPTTGPTTKNTKDAASETLKKYFGGR